MEKSEARERRNRLVHVAGAAGLSLTEGIREMRAIAGMTQEEFARHRGVSARVIKALELGQGNPTVATLNRIAELFGLEVALVPKQRLHTPQALATTSAMNSNEAFKEAPAGWLADPQSQLIELMELLRKNLSQAEAHVHMRPPDQTPQGPIDILPAKKKAQSRNKKTS